jgi:hypothetical protein
MTNPTTPFNWQMPTASDLVTDLPADFETFGQAVATSMADLLGGTTGQVLSKASNTDMDFTWVAQDDSNAIQNAIVDAKGDLIAATGADTPARLAVGTNGYGLTADSTASTGLAWTPTYGSTAGFQRGTSNQTISANAWVKIQLNSEDFDTDGSYDPTTNYRFTPKVAGYYQFNTMIYVVGQTGGVNIAIYKNGGFIGLVDFSTVGSDQVLGHGFLATANGSTDYFEWYCYSQTNNCTIVNRSGGSPTTVTWLRGL